MPTPRTTLADQVALAALPEILRQRPLPDGGPRDPDYWGRVMQSAHAAANAYMQLRGEKLARQRGGK